MLYNSFSRQDQNNKDLGSRKKYFNNIGHLYPGRTCGDKSLNECRDYKDFQEKLGGTTYFNYF